MPRTLSIFILAVSLSVYASPVFAQENLARLGVEQLPPLRVASETKETLLALGCRPEIFTAETRSVLVSPESPYPVVPVDLQGTEIFFCSQETLAQLHIQGQVLDWDWLGFVKGLASGATGVSPAIGSALADGVGTVISFLFDTLAQVANVILHLAAAGVVPLLKTGSFLTNPIVTSGWPIVLGIANLGFVLGLLFIATTTILRVSGFDARRLLVRLLIAALLINFSLVLAGVILDLSRLATAAIYTGLVGKSLDNLGINLLTGSDLVKRAFSIESSNSILGFELPGGVQGASLTRTNNSVLDSILAFLMISLLAAAFVALIAGLLVRYFMLIILLIVSPLAYLFVALPGTGHLARKWWDYFIRYAVYGPVVVFILGLVVRLSEPKVAEAMSTEFGDIFGKIIMLIITTVFLFGAAMAGKYVGVAAASAASGFVWGRTAGRAGRGALGLAGRVPGAVYQGAAAIPYAGVPLRAPQFVRGLAKGLGQRIQQRATKVEDVGFELTKPRKPFKLKSEQEEETRARREIEQATDLGMDVDVFRKLSPAERQRQLRGIYGGGGVPPAAPGGEQQPTGSGAGPAAAKQPPASAIPQAQAVPIPVQSVAQLGALAQQASQVFEQVTDGTRSLAQALQDPALQGTNLRHTAVKQALGAENIAQIVGNSNNGNQIKAIIEDRSYVQGLSDQDLARITQALYDNPNFDGDRKANLLDNLHQRIT